MFIYSTGLDKNVCTNMTFHTFLDAMNQFRRDFNIPNEVGNSVEEIETWWSNRDNAIEVHHYDKNDEELGTTQEKPIINLNIGNEHMICSINAYDIFDDWWQIRKICCN